MAVTTADRVTAGRVTADRVTAGQAVAAADEQAAVHGREPGAQRCLWCGRELPSAGTVGRRRRYCAQACRQRAYENRSGVQRGELPADSVVLSVQERDDLADRLYQVRCAAEDVATALTEGASPGELEPLVAQLMVAARSAERIR